MPSARKKPTQASSSSSSGPKPFNFKSVKRDKTSTGGGGGDGARQSRPTTARVHKCQYQEGHERAGEDTGNRDLLFDPRWGLNEKAKEEVAKHAYGKDVVRTFNKELGGFPVRVHAPKQAMRMHDALRKLDATMREDLDLGDWTEPEVMAATLTNLDLPATKTHAKREGVTATMLDGYTYPLYKKLRPLGYDFVRDVHGKEGVNRWVRVHEDKEDAAKMQQALEAMLNEEGWRVDFAVGDAACWGSDDEE